MEIFDKLAFYFQYDMVRYTLIVGVLTALCSSLLGVTLVLKRFSFIGDGLSHVAFGAVAIATALSLQNHFLLVLPVTIIAAILLLRTGQNAKIKGDAALAMLSVGALGLGYLVMNISARQDGARGRSASVSADVCATLFGSASMLTLQRSEVIFSAVLAILVLVVFLVFYHKIFAVTFDEDFMRATGLCAKVYNLILAVTIAVIIVLAMNLVGALLISALVIFPALSAMRVFKTFKSVTICAVIIAIICVVLGILISIVTETPVGSMIVATFIGGFLVFSILGLAMKKIG